MSFQHPEFLYGLFAILIPLAIHFFNFRRHKKIWFSHVALLKQITIESKKQRSVLHLIVLLLRILTIILLVIALSQPNFGKKEATTLSNTQHLYIDNSFSMMQEGARGRLFNNAVNEAKKLVQSSPQNFRFILSTNDFFDRQQKKLSPEETLSALDQIKISPTESKLSSTILSRLNSQQEQHQFLLFSDFQRNKTDIGQWPSDSAVTYQLFPFSSSKNNNLLVDSVWFSTPILIPYQKTTCYIRITNKTAQFYDKLPVTLAIDGQQKGVSSVDLQAFKSVTISISYTPQTSGWKQGLITIDDYPVTFDDALYFTFKVVPHINILAINDRGQSPWLRNFYNSDSLFAFREVESKRVNYNALDQYDLIILNGLDEYSSGLSQQLTQYIRAGGNTLLISNNTLSEQPFLANAGLNAALSVDTSDTRVSGIKLKSDLFENSISRIPQNADLPKIFTHTRYQFPTKSGVESLITLLNGDDLLVKYQMEKGRLFLLTTGISDDFSTLSSNLLFAPLFGGIATGSGTSDQLFHIVGNDELTLKKIPPSSGDDPIIVENTETGQSFIPELRTTSGYAHLNTHGHITASGYYHIMQRDSLIAIAAYNYNREESDLECYTAIQLDSLCRMANLPHYAVVDVSDMEFEEMISKLKKENPVWKLFIIFALLALAAEGLVLRLRK
ncbi:MAG: BatA domain-containing protein [Bacteroidetes bacterium]|nr:BatA domain-containing protein [Bacteroidota bacterium]